MESQYLPYVSILPAFAALQTALRALPAPRQLDAQRKLRHWYWASVFTNRYSGSVESVSISDYRDVKAWFDDDAAEPGLIAESQARFEALDQRRELKRGTSVYDGIFNLLAMRGARDWMTGNVPQYGDLDDHHIVPKSWGKEKGLGGAIDSILNRTPLTANTNRNDRPRTSAEPVPTRANRGERRSQRSEATLESHFISPAAFAHLLRLRLHDGRLRGLSRREATHAQRLDRGRSGEGTAGPAAPAP